MLADFHLHSEFSDDSREPMERQIERAIELGFQEICFTDHVDYGIKKDWSEGGIIWRGGDGMNYGPDALEPLANVNYPEYFGKLMRMRETYGKKITIRQGLEFGIQQCTLDHFERLWHQYGDRLDFTLLSMHQIDNQELWNQQYQSGKSQKEYNEGYYREILEVMKRFSHYCVLAHLDLIVRYDHNGIYPFEKVRDLIAEILRQAISDGKGIEVNTSYRHYQLSDTQPSKAILKLYRDLGGRIITIGSDAHTIRWLGDHVRETMEMLRDELGYEQFCTFTAMEPVFHAI